MNRNKNDADLFRDLNSIYFCPERMGAYPSPRIRRLAKKAVKLLLGTEQRSPATAGFGRDEIRDLLINRMMPEQLDSAIERYLLLRRMRPVRKLALLLIENILCSESAAEILYAHDHGSGGGVL